MSEILMMIGAGVMQYPAIEVARQAGYKVVSVDGNEKAMGRGLSDYFLHADISDWEQVVRVAEKFHRDNFSVQGVMTVGTDFSYTVAKVAEALHLTGISPQTALAATNKGIMRTKFKEQGVPCPDFVLAGSLQQAKDLMADIGFPCVIKPVDNMGARGVRMIRDPKELEESFPDAVKFSRSRQVILEQYMEGPELSVDTLVYKGEVHLLTIADRIISGEPYFVERGHTLPSALPEKTLQDVFRVMKQGIRALGITVGASKADMKVTPQGPMIGEMTARLSGGFHSQYTDPLSTGMNSIKAAVDIAMGKPLSKGDITAKYHKGACERSLYPPSGRVTRITGVDEASRMPGIKKVFLNVAVGDILYPIISNMNKAGHVIAFGETRESAISCCEKAMERIEIKTVAI